MKLFHPLHCNTPLEPYVVSDSNADTYLRKGFTKESPLTDEEYLTFTEQLTTIRECLYFIDIEKEEMYEFIDVTLHNLKNPDNKMEYADEYKNHICLEPYEEDEDEPCVIVVENPKKRRKKY